LESKEAGVCDEYQRRLKPRRGRAMDGDNGRAIDLILWIRIALDGMTPW